VKIKSAFLGAAFAGSIFVAGAAQAALITTATGNYYAFPDVNLNSAGPETVAPGITYTSTNLPTSDSGGAVYGWSNGYNFVQSPPNDVSSGIPLVGLNDSTDNYGVADSITFSFASPVSVVGAVLNWSLSDAPVTIEALDSSNKVLESYTLSSGGINTVGISPNSFFGFKESTNSISAFVLTDGYIAAIGGVNAATAGVGAIPEISTWAMMLAGFAGLGVLGYRRHKAVTLTA
jgi:hypothetical protein